MSEEVLETVTVRVSGCERVLQYRAGTSDMAAIGQIYRNQEYDLGRLRRGREIFEFVEAESSVGMHPLIIDAGANIGASTVFFALTFPDALIVAIEPEIGNFDLLRQNTEGLRVRCLRAALSSSPGKVRLVDPGEGHWGYRTEASSGGEGIVCVTVPDVFAIGRPRFPFIVKIDIEGAEREVFSKNTEWVARTPIIMVELHDWLLPKGGSSQAFLRSIADQPRDFIIVGENVFSITHSLYDAAYDQCGSGAR